MNAWFPWLVSISLLLNNSSYPNILVQTTLSPASTMLYMPHSLPHLQTENWLSFFFLNFWWDLANVVTINESSFSTSYLTELTPPRLLFPLYLLQSFYFISMITFLLFYYSHDKNHGLLLIQFLVLLIFLIF